MKDWLWRWGPAVLVMAVIFIASATPSSDLPTLGSWDFVAKKGSHMLGYALLSVAIFHGLNNRKSITRPQFMLAVCLAVIYAASDEWHQKYTPGRSPSLSDVLIDATGAALGLALWCSVRERFLRWQKALTGQG
jgi:VanZ family protein